MKSILIKDTTREERGSPFGIYQDYIDGKREISEINMTYMEQYRQNRMIK